MRKHFVLVLRVVKDEFGVNKKVANLAPINHFVIRRCFYIMAYNLPTGLQMVYAVT